MLSKKKRGEILKILMLSWEYPPRIVGGIARVVHDLAQKLAEEGNEVHVVTCWEPNTKEYEKDKNVFVHRVHTFNINANFIEWVHHLNFSMVEYCIRLFNDSGNFDVIHAHDWIVAFAARTLKYSYRIPLVSTIHATEYGRNGGLHNDLQRYIASVEWWLTYESWKVICNSNYMKSEIKYIFQLPDDKIQVIPNGVDPKIFDGIQRDYEFRRNYAADNEKIVFFVGRLVHEKGAGVLIEAVPKILYYYNDVKFVIAGKGPQMDYLKNRVEEMGLANKVYFTGFVHDNVRNNLFKCADVDVLPSLYEPFGIVALEGMVAGVPVVVADTGGLGEIINHGHDGMKAYVGNANSLADSILALLHEKDLADKCVKNALDKVNQIYNWSIIAKQTFELYKEVVKDSKKSNWKPVDLKKMVGVEGKKVSKNTENYYKSTYDEEKKK